MKKIAFWGSVASIIGLVISLVSIRAHSQDTSTTGNHNISQINSTKGSTVNINYGNAPSSNDKFSSDTLKEISNFARDICDDISPKGSKKSQVLELKGRLAAEKARIAEIIGVEISAGGNATYGSTKEEYEGLPINNISEQMTDSRACKKEITKMLIREMKKVHKRLGSDQLILRENEILELSNDYILLRAEFIDFADMIGLEYGALPEGNFDQATYDKHLKNKLLTMGGKMQGMLLITSLMPTVQNIGKGSKEITRELERFDSSKVTDKDKYRTILSKSQSVQQRSNAVLFEMLDIIQSGG